MYVMAFLRSICGQRAKNLFYSRSNKLRFETSISSNWSSFSCISRPTEGIINGSNNSNNNRLNLGARPLEDQLLIHHNYQHHQRFLHSNSAKQRSETITASSSTLATKVARPSLTKQNGPNIPINPQRDPLDVSFNDPHAAFKSKTTWELIRAYIVYLVCSSEKLVEHNMKVIISNP